MTPSYKQIKNRHFLYDPTLLQDIGPEWFDPEALRRSERIKGAARGSGRGTALFISDGSHEFVLRHYKRGGFIAKVIDDHYLWQGLERTRAWREWHLLHWMFEHGLPVPRPAAMHVEKTGYAYIADLLTIAIPACHSLADHIAQQTVTDQMLFDIGQCTRRFHAVGIYHADLNAFNILINEEGLVYLIDFDRGCRRSLQKTWQNANLSRLRRSLSKQERKAVSSTFSEEKWQHLLNGYKKRVE